TFTLWLPESLAESPGQAPAQAPSQTQTQAQTQAQAQAQADGELPPAGSAGRPIRAAPGGQPAARPASRPPPRPHDADDRVLLVVEDDPAFAQILGELAREHGFEAVIAHDARDGLRVL